MLADPDGRAATQNPGRSKQNLVASAARDPGKPAQSQERFVHSFFTDFFLLFGKCWWGGGGGLNISRRLEGDFLWMTKCSDPDTLSSEIQDGKGSVLYFLYDTASIISFKNRRFALELIFAF